MAACHEAARCHVDPAQQEDFLSEYFIGCLMSPDPANIALTCACGANRARSYLRREKRWRVRIVHGEVASVFLLSEATRLLLSHPDVSLQPMQAALCRELGQRFEEALCRLTERQHRVLYLRYYECLPFVRIARETGQSPTAVRVMAHAAHQRLLEILSAEELSCWEAIEYLSLMERTVP